MKLLLSLFFTLFIGESFSQTIDFESEKNIIRQTLSQYLDENPNSMASYMKGKKMYKFAVS